MNIEVTISLSIYFIGMLAIGWYAFRKTHDLNDYMLGGRGLYHSLQPFQQVLRI